MEKIYSWWEIKCTRIEERMTHLMWVFGNERVNMILFVKLKYDRYKNASVLYKILK